LNRGVEQRPNKRPMMSDLKDSGSIEADADTIMFLYRDEVYNPDSMDRGKCEVIIAKQRQGETGTVGVAFIGEQQRFEDLAHGVTFGVKPEPNRRHRGFD
jgi:replicative DNA helicase